MHHKMAAGGLGSMKVEPGKRDLREAPPTGSMARLAPHVWSLEIIENLEGFSNLRVIFLQGPC